MHAITNLMLLLHPHLKHQIQTRNESTLDNPPFDSIECIHDIRMVWSPEASADEDLYKLAAYPCHPLLLGRGIS